MQHPPVISLLSVSLNNRLNACESTTKVVILYPRHATCGCPLHSFIKQETMKLYLQAQTTISTAVPSPTSQTWRCWGRHWIRSRISASAWWRLWTTACGFHSLFRADEWILYECEGPRSGTILGGRGGGNPKARALCMRPRAMGKVWRINSLNILHTVCLWCIPHFDPRFCLLFFLLYLTVGARALALGRFWKRDGTLAVSVAQEGVARGKMIPSRGESKLWLLEYISMGSIWLWEVADTRTFLRRRLLG